MERVRFRGNFATEQLTNEIAELEKQIKPLETKINKASKGILKYCLCCVGAVKPKDIQRLAELKEQLTNAQATLNSIVGTIAEKSSELMNLNQAPAVELVKHHEKGAKFAGWEPQTKSANMTKQNIEMAAMALNKLDKSKALDFVKKLGWLEAFKIITIVPNTDLRNYLLDELLDNMEGALDSKFKYKESRAVLAETSVLRNTREIELDGMLKMYYKSSVERIEQRFLRILGKYGLMG